MKSKKHCTAIVLSAGQGKRMGASVQKQYIELDGKPVIYYTIKAFQESGIIDDIVLVVGNGQISYVKEEIVDLYGFTKVHTIVEGGKERYDSVWSGLQTIKNEDGYAFIHDGARLFVNEDIIRRGYETVEAYKACVAGMPSKDTVKIVDENTFASETPNRKYVWSVQTPQIFETSLIKEAYRKIMQGDCAGVTDDAMVVEKTMSVPVKLFEGSYENIKITTPEDLSIAKMFLKKNKKVKKGVDVRDKVC